MGPSAPSTCSRARARASVSVQSATAAVASEFLAVDPGYVCGIVQDGIGYRDGVPVITLHMEAYLGAPESFDASLRDVAARHGATVVDVRQVFARAARDGIVGADLMLEHVHPNVEGYFQLANAFYGALVEWAADGERLIVDSHPEASVVFADVVDFTGLAATTPPRER